MEIIQYHILGNELERYERHGIARAHPIHTGAGWDLGVLDLAPLRNFQGCLNRTAKNSPKYIWTKKHGFLFPDVVVAGESYDNSNLGRNALTLPEHARVVIIGNEGTGREPIIKSFFLDPKFLFESDIENPWKSIEADLGEKVSSVF